MEGVLHKPIRKSIVWVSSGVWVRALESGHSLKQGGPERAV
jgi:hypothetical protein